MMTVRTTEGHSDITRYWPFALGGLLAPLGANVIARWTSLPLAAGISFLIVWTLAFCLFHQGSIDSDRGTGRTIAAGAVAALTGAVVTGFLAYFMPWR